MGRVIATEHMSLDGFVEPRDQTTSVTTGFSGEIDVAEPDDRTVAGWSYRTTTKPTRRDV